jgi:hypothetical protein
MKNKKSQGLSINVMIIAIIALIILVISVALLTNKTAIFSKSVGGSCRDQGGICLYDSGRDSCSDVNGKPLRIIASGCPSDKSDTKKERGPCCLSLNE